MLAPGYTLAMRREPGRREFLQTLSAGAVALLGLRRLAAETGPRTDLGGGLSVLHAAGNIVTVESPDGWLAINGSTAPSPRLVRILINTDWHPQQTGFNVEARKSGATIVAHEYTKQYLHRAKLRDGLPTKTFYTSETIRFGGHTIECASLGQAHTDGDISVLFTEQNVLVAGDMLTVGAYPIADVASGGWLGGMVTATKTLLDLTNEQTRVIPGAGPVQTRAALEAQHRMLSAVRERFVKMMRQGMSADDMLAGGITKEFDAQWGDPREFIQTAYKGMWLHVRELGGIV